jgi:hypothetical protein
VEGPLSTRLLGNRAVLFYDLSSGAGKDVDSKQPVEEVLCAGVIAALCRESARRDFHPVTDAAKKASAGRPVMIAQVECRKWKERTLGEEAAAATWGRVWTFKYTTDLHGARVDVQRGYRCSLESVLDHVVTHLLG